MAIDMSARSHGFVYPMGLPPCAQCGRDANDQSHVNPARGGTNSLMRGSYDGSTRVLSGDKLTMKQPRRSHAYATGYASFANIPCQACGQPMGASCHTAGMPAGAGMPQMAAQGPAQKNQDTGTGSGAKEGYGQIVLTRHPFQALEGTNSIDAPYKLCAKCGFAADDEVHQNTGDGDADKNLVSVKQLARLTERTPPAPGLDANVRSQQAFVTQLNGKVILSAPANVFTVPDDEMPREVAAEWERASAQNPHFMWIDGRFVEADRPNRNKAAWSSADLEMGEPTVAHGPLNWLHEERHIIGTIAAAKLVTTRQVAGTLTADELPNNHIRALAAVWNYLWPTEGRQIAQASDERKLWYCVDDQTELLTADGWKRHDELVDGELMLTLNTGLGMSEWLPLDRVFRYEVDTDLVSWEGQQMSALTTPNHRWLIQQRDSKTGARSFQWRETHELTNASYVHRAVPHHFAPEIGKFRDEFVELVAWMQTEGTFCKGGGSVIYQSHAANPQKVERIRTALLRLFGAPGYAKDGGSWYASHHGKMTHFHLTAASTAPFKDVLDGSGKVVAPRWYSQLSEAQLRLFIETSIDGDGTRARSDGQVSFVQNSLEAVRSFEVACALAGIPTNTSANADANGCWRVCLVRKSNTLAPRRLARMGKGFVESVQRYVGIVWCPSTTNGTFLARRRGTVYWTGNSMECTSREVACLQDSCTHRQSYRDYMLLPQTRCQHVKAGANRQFVDPTFLGGAVILAPVRPGWGGAHASVMRQAAMMAERQEASFDGLTTSEAELMVAQIITFAGGPA